MHDVLVPLQCTNRDLFVQSRARVPERISRARPVVLGPFRKFRFPDLLCISD